MNKTLTKAERTRQFIIQKTAPIFNTKGFAGTYLSDLTKATGLTKGSIYGNFESKDEVALVAFDYNFSRVNDYLKKRILSVDGAIERLLVYPNVYRDFLKISFLQPGCPILNTSTEADDTHPKLRLRAANALEYWRKSIKIKSSEALSVKRLKTTLTRPKWQ